MNQQRLVRVQVLEDTTDSQYKYFYRGDTEVVPANHPCMRHFKVLEDVKPEQYEEELRAKAELPAGVVPRREDPNRPPIAARPAIPIDETNESRPIDIIGSGKRKR